MKDSHTRTNNPKHGPSDSRGTIDSEIFIGGGEMGRRINAFDWSKTSLGPISEWPDSLKLSVNIILHSAMGMVLLWGKDGIMIYNDGFIDFAAAKHPSSLGSKVLEEWPEAADFNKNVLKVCLQGGNLSYKDQPLILHRKGEPEEVWFDSDYNPIVGLDGKPEGILSIIIETTERVLSEQARENAVKQATYILESTKDSIFMLDKDWNIVIVNTMHEKVTKTKRADILGKYFWDVFPAGPQSKYWIEHHKVMQTRKPSHFDEYYEPLDLWTSTDVYPTPDGGIAVFFRDISSKKKSEIKERELLSITSERNALVKINKTKDEFIGMASHQLRTPATVVKQYLGLILDDFAGPITDQQRIYLEIANASNERGLGTIDDLLKTAQIASSQYRLSKKLHNVSKILEECVNNLQSTFDMRQQKVVLTMADNELQAVVDATEMGLVISNLLENASKYSYPGSTITVSIVSTKDCLKIAITDTGVGIGKKDRERIFDKFTRVDNKLSDTVSGTGLGLYWVKEIVEMHGGKITLESELNKGSTFTIELPL